VFHLSNYSLFKTVLVLLVYVLD